MHLDRDSFHYLQSRFFKRAQLKRVVRDDAHMTEAKIIKNFGALPVLARVYRQAQELVGFDSVRAFVLQGIGTNLVKDSDSASLLLLIDDSASAFLLNHLHGAMKLPAAVALG